MRPKQPRIKLSPIKYAQLTEYVFCRDGFCVFCGTSEMLTPAHVIRRSQGGHDAANNLVTACMDCHTAFDSYKIGLPHRVAAMLENEPGAM